MDEGTYHRVDVAATHYGPLRKLEDQDGPCAENAHFLGLPEES